MWFKFGEPVLIQVLWNGCDELTQNSPPLFPFNIPFPLQLSPSSPLHSPLPTSFYPLYSGLLYSSFFYFFGGTHPSYINDHNLTLTNPIMKKSKFLSVLNDEDLYYRVTWCESAQLKGEKNLSCGLQLLSRLQAACLSPSTTESPTFRTVLGMWSLLSR